MCNISEFNYLTVVKVELRTNTGSLVTGKSVSRPARTLNGASIVGAEVVTVIIITWTDRSACPAISIQSESILTLTLECSL